MFLTEIILLELVLLIFCCVCSCSVWKETETQKPTPHLYNQQDFKNNNERNGDMHKLKLEIDILNTKNCEANAKVSALESKNLECRANITSLKEKCKKLEEKLNEIESELEENKLNECYKRQNDSKPVKINGLLEQIMEDIISGDWSKSIELMKLHLDHNTQAYKQVNSVSYFNCPLEAAERGYIELIQVMLDNGLPINQGYGINSYTLLHKAASYGQYELVQFLIQRGAVVNLRALNGFTALHNAARNGHETIVQLLVENGADINATDEYEDTPLHDAARNGHRLVVQYLLNKGAILL